MATTLMLPSSALTQTPQLTDATLRTVSPGSGEFIGIETSRTLKNRQFAVGTFIGYSTDLFVLRNGSGQAFASVIDNRLSADFSSAYGLPWLEVGIIAPYIFSQSGIDQPTAGIPAVSGGGLGDLRLFVRRRLLGQENGFALGASLTLDLPTSQVSFAGEDLASLTPRLVPEWRGRWVSATLNLGAKVRDSVDVVNTEVGTAFQGGAGIALRNRWIEPLSLLGEFSIEAAGEAKSQIPYEARGVARWNWTDTLNMFLGYGKGLSSGVGAPNQRLVFMMTYRPPPRAEKPQIIQQIVAAPELATIRKDRIELNGELFAAADSDRIPSRAAPMLDAIAKKMTDNPWIRKLQIIGHADTNGGMAFNHQLSLRRAKALVKGLVDRGVEPQRLQAYAVAGEAGSAQPIELLIIEKDPSYQPPSPSQQRGAP